MLIWGMTFCGGEEFVPLVKQKGPFMVKGIAWSAGVREEQGVNSGEVKVTYNRDSENRINTCSR